MTLPRYGEYKNCRIPWIGQAPAHWDVIALGRAAIDRCDGPFGSGIKSEHYTDSGAVVVRLQNIRAGRFHHGDPVYLNQDYFERELRGHEVLPGDVLVAGLGDDINLLGRACVAPENLGSALVKADCFRFRVDQRRALPAFVASQLSAGAQFDAGTLSSGTTRSRIPLGTMATRMLALPPLREQATIVSFLVRETAKIDTLIAEQKKLIALLAEKRQATISHAVTRGLDPNAPMKDSGVPWLGELPGHWFLPPLYLRYEADLGKMLDTSRITGEHSIPYLRNVDVQWDSINLVELPRMDIEAREYPRYTVRDGDLLVCEGGEVGRAAVVRVGEAIIGFQKALHRLRALSEQEHPRFMFYTFVWAANAGAFAGEGQSTIAHLTGEQLRKYRFPKPPLSEQVEIAEFLDAEMEKLSELATEAAAAVDLLKERRSALIAAAVTGKIDVRGEVPALRPEQAEATA